MVSFHKNKKLTSVEWTRLLKRGRVADAVRRVNPHKQRGPWKVLCDNEKFLDARESKTAYAACSVELWHVPPRSPDLNPIEKCWSWLPKQLKVQDLADLHAKRRTPNKAAYTARIRALLRTQRAQNVAKACAKSLNHVCKVVVSKKGAASGS